MATSKRAPSEGPMIESLESRVLLSISFEFDYSLDTNGFFEDQGRRDVLELAGSMLSSFLDDGLAEIQEGGQNTWTATIIHPGTGEQEFGIDGLFVPEDTLIVYAGGRELGGILGRGGAGGFSAGGSQQWLDLVTARGEPGALGPTDERTDFGPWGGSITFDTKTNWYFGSSSDDLSGSEFDFLSVALHELTHLLGFSGGTDSFVNLISGTSFMGSTANQEFDFFGPPQLDADMSHWEEGTTDEQLEVVMDPSITAGVRKLPTRLDLGALDDLGWDIELGTQPGDGQILMLSPLTGDTSVEALIEFENQVAVFEFTSLSGGRAFAQVVDEVVALDLGIRVYNQAGLLVASDDFGHIGADADVEFLIDGGGDGYTIEVVALSGDFGAYTLRIDTEPVVHQKYYPEGFANNNISEFVSITNPNDFEVTYTITLRYEDPGLDRDESIVAQDVTVGGGLRSGVTISDKGFLAPDLLNGGTIVKNTPYAIIVSSDGPLAVSMSHFDFSIATGESFTDVTSTQWAFPRAERRPGEVNDFLVFYNPNDHVSHVTMTLLVPGAPNIEFSQDVQPMRRSGWGFNFISAPTGVYGVVVTSEALDPGDEPDHIGIVAALTHFDTTTTKGWGALGDPTDGSSFGVIPSLIRSDEGDIEIGFMNLGLTSAVVQIIGTYESGLPGFATNRTVPAGSTLFVTGAQLGLINGQRASITYSSILNNPVVVQAQDTSFGDGTATGASTEVGREFVFGDAFINANQAGENYFETLSFFNPDSADIDVTVEIFFNDGVAATVTQTVGANGFSHLDLHELPAILDHANLNFFGIRLSADSPFAVTLEHFDLFFGSGWRAAGAPIGFTTPLDQIT